MADYKSWDMYLRPKEFPRCLDTVKIYIQGLIPRSLKRIKNAGVNFDSKKDRVVIYCSFVRTDMDLYEYPIQWFARMFGRILVCPSFKVITNEGAEFIIFPADKRERHILEQSRMNKRNRIMFILEKMYKENIILDIESLMKRMRKEIYQITRRDMVEQLLLQYPDMKNGKQVYLQLVQPFWDETTLVNFDIRDIIPDGNESKNIYLLEPEKWKDLIPNTKGAIFSRNTPDSLITEMMKSGKLLFRGTGLKV